MGSATERDRRCGLGRALIVWLALAGTAVPQSSVVPDQIGPIISALRNEKYDEALSAARQTLARNPQNYKVWTLEGMALAGKGENGAALAAFRYALAIEPAYSPALKAEARLLFQSRDKRATEVLRKLIALDPADQTAKEMLAVSEARQDDCAAAIAAFKPVEESVRAHADALQWYGYCLTREKKLPEAAAAFARLVELVPDDAIQRFDLALVQTMDGKNAEALDTLAPCRRRDRPMWMC